MKEIENYFPKAFLARQGTTFEALKTRLESVGNDFVTALNEADDETLYAPVAEGKWSPAEIADHLVRANRLFSRALDAALSGEEMVEMPRGKVTDDGRPIAPTEEEPESDRARAELTEDFTASVDELSQFGARMQSEGKLEQDCLDHSFFGPMIGLEVLQLAAWHVRHHTKQLSHR